MLKGCFGVFEKLLISKGNVLGRGTTVLLSELDAESHGGNKGGSEERFHCLGWCLVFDYNLICEGSLLYVLISCPLWFR